MSLRKLSAALREFDKGLREDSICDKCQKPKQGFISSLNEASAKRQINSLCDCEGQLTEALSKTDMNQKFPNL